MSERGHLQSKYQVTRQFTAYSVQSTGGVNDPFILPKGLTVWADPDFWKDIPQQGKLVVRFLYNTSWFYVDRATFESSTRKR